MERSEIRDCRSRISALRASIRATTDLIRRESRFADNQ